MACDKYEAKHSSATHAWQKWHCKHDPRLQRISITHSKTQIFVCLTIVNGTRTCESSLRVHKQRSSCHSCVPVILTFWLHKTVNSSSFLSLQVFLHHKSIFLKIQYTGGIKSAIPYYYYPIISYNHKIVTHLGF